jgi:hypothetical protein
MSQLRKRNSGLTDISLAAIMLGLTIVSSSGAIGPLPATPCPCAADGMCYPNRGTWGNYTTNWRVWPGESIGLTPTPAAVGPELQQELPIFLRPQPDQEDLRGPAKSQSAAAPAAESAAPGGEQPAEEAEEAPANDGLEIPGFGPQGSLQPLPQIEDGPPALPRSLSHALPTQPNTQINLRHNAFAKATVNVNPVTASRPLSTSVAVAHSPYVTPTAGISANNIQLGNPAAAKVQKTMDQDLQQAIYFEASDMPGKTN